MSFSLSSTSTSPHLLPRRRLVESQTASANVSISDANMNMKMFNRNSGMEIGGMEGVDPVRVQRSTKTSARNDEDGDPVFKLQRKLTQKSEKPERQVRFRERSALSPDHEGGDQQEEHHDDDENGFKCERLRSAAGFGVDLSTYPEAAPYSVFLASLQRFVPRRIVHRPHLRIGDEKDTDEHKAPEKEQDLFAELRKSAHMPYLISNANETDLSMTVLY